jgi:hypothetical protein
LSVADIDAKYRPLLESQLESGEELHGLCIGSQQKGFFRGGAAVIGITDRRLMLQPLDRRGNLEGSAESIGPEQIASAEAGGGGGGGGWYTVPSGILDHAAVQLRIKTTGGEKLKLTLMRGKARMLGGLSGGEPQRLGLKALAEWFRAIDT